MKTALLISLMALLVASQTVSNTQRRIKKVTLDKSEKSDQPNLDAMLSYGMPPAAMPQTKEPEQSQNDLQKDCDLKEPSLRRDYACLELSVLTLDAFDVKTLKTLANTVVLIKAQAGQQKHKALAQVNRLMGVQRKILKAKEVIMGQGCQWMCGNYAQTLVPFDQDEIVASFTRDYVTAFGRYAHVCSAWRSAVVLRAGWAGIRKVMYSYFDWSVSTYYPYYYSLYWVPSNGVFFSSIWWNAHVFSFCQPLYAFNTYREPSVPLEPSMVKGLEDQELSDLVHQTNELDEQKSTEDNAAEEALEDQLNKGTLDAGKLRSQFEAQEDALQSEIKKQEQEEPVEDEDKEEKEKQEEKRRQEEQQSQVHGQEKRRQEELKSHQEEEEKQKGRQQDMFNLGNDLDSLPQEHKPQEEDTTGCDYVVEAEAEAEIEPCQDVPQEHCGTYCVKSPEGIRRVQGVRKEFMGQQHKKQQEEIQGQQGNTPQDWSSEMFRRMDKVNGKAEAKKDPKTARLNKQQVKMDNSKIAESNNMLLSKIAGLLSKLGDSMEPSAPKRHKSRHHRH